MSNTYLVFVFVTIFSSPLGLEAEPQSGDVIYSEDDFMSLLLSTYGNNRFLEEQCFEFQDCLQIRDKVLYHRGRKKVLRAAMKGSLSMTSAYLKLPKKLVKSELDTRKWKVDFDIAPYGPSRTMANEIFANGSISRANTSNTHVLVLGLGGGLLSGYLHQNFPQMKITAVDISPTVVSMAKKWFSLEPDERYQVVVEDGVQYLRRSVQQGLRFDAIVLDACFMESELDLTCPAKVFLSDEPIENMATLLGQRGVLTVNFLYRSKIAKDKALEKFHKFFKYDKEVDLRPFRNYVHTFTQFEAPRSREDKPMERSFA